MEYLFTATGTDVATSSFKEFFPSVNRSMAWAQLEPYMKQATRTYLLRYLDTATYTLISGNGTGAELTEARELLKMALAYYTIYDAMPHLNAVISDMGVRENTNETSVPISQWRFKNARWEALTKADNFMDQALEYIASKPIVFTSYSFTGSVFFKDTSKFLEYSTVAGRRAFQAILPYIREAEDILEAELCDFYAEVVDMVPNTGDIQKKLIHYCRRFIAHEAMSRAIPRLLLYIDADGIKVTSSSDSFDTRSNVLSSFGKDGPDKLVRALNINSKEAMKHIFAWLHKNKTEAAFSTWADAQPTYEDTPVITSSSDGVGGIGLF